MIVLHGVSASPYVRKVLFALRLKGLSFEHLQQMPFANDPEFNKISPLGKVPALQDGDLTICDSTVICEYLEDAYPKAPIYPCLPADRAKARWVEEYCGSRVTELATGIFFQRVMRPMVFQQEADEKLVAKIIGTDMPPVFEYLESLIPAEGYLFGDVGLADVSLVSPFINASYAGFEVDAERWPKLSAFIEKVKSHEIMQSLLGAEAVVLESNGL
ncbi:glutathione S-transferase family protein [Maricurvus nonylphenolicus]|uniref:glutathione S-transferase family protein n=1 Tax=Maricurvus nonylphenolicus TaxID=1008307 RepID=UPI0036F36C51